MAIKKSSNTKTKSVKKVQKENIKKLKKDKKLKTKKSKKMIVLNILVFGAIGLTSLFLLFALFIIISSPDFDKSLLYKSESTVLYAKDGSEISRIGSENRVLVTYEDLPEVLIDAIVATEDSRYFQHNGFDAARFTKATFGQLTGNSAAGGASTLTMQVIKNTYTSSEDEGIKGIIRKFTDIYMAVFKLESSYTKEEILEFYVNSQWLGHDGNINYGGIYGVEQASQYFFNKSVSDLNLSEASLLAGMFQNPALYNPYRNPKNATARRSTVLKLMVRHGYITEEERQAAEAIPVQSMLAEKRSSDANPYQSFIDYVLDEVQDKTGKNPHKEPMAIYTTLDKDKQGTLTSLERGDLYKFANDKIQYGLAITSLEDGSITAMSAGRDYVANGTNRATDKKQPGSTAKIIFDYGPYIEYLDGSPYSLFYDEPYQYSNGTAIRNADNSYMGLITMRKALVKSRNIPALQAFQAVMAKDPNLIPNFAHSLGIDYGSELYEAAAIGGFDGISPLQMSAAYAAFGRGGYYIEPYSFTKIVYLDTDKEYEYKPEKVKVMSEQTAYLITDILVEGGKSGVAGTFSISGTDFAAKGGTSTVDESSAKQLGIPANTTPNHWNVTYDPEYSIALWYGYDKMSKDYYLLSNPGVKARRAIMEAVAKRVYSTNKTFTRPSGIVSAKVEYETMPAQAPSEFTPGNLITADLFKQGTEPSETSPRFAQLNAPTGGSANFDGTAIKLSWTGISEPEVNTEAWLKKYGETGYGSYFASRFASTRMAYNQSAMGVIGYQIYLQNGDGSLSNVDYTTNTNYTYNVRESGTYNFVVKSAYSIFKNNMSNGLNISSSANIETNVNNMVTDPNKTEAKTEPSKNTNKGVISGNGEAIEPDNDDDVDVGLN
ncbi:MAG: transglycosylase domain-containing protein [Bacilli bacterium]|nr:transglycosylase domain-containing protein [Bacilli bacterium]